MIVFIIGIKQMLNPLSFRQIKNYFYDLEATKVIFWEMYYLPRSNFGVRTEFDDVGAGERMFNIGLVFTIFKNDNTFYRLIQNAEKLSGEELALINCDPKLLAKKYTPGAINFWFFRELPMRVITGTYEFLSIGKVRVNYNSIIDRNQNKEWIEKNNNMEDNFELDYQLVSPIKKYFAIASFNAASSEAINGIDLLESSIAKIQM
jgi:hypothetical protein